MTKYEKLYQQFNIQPQVKAAIEINTKVIIAELGRGNFNVTRISEAAESIVHLCGASQKNNSVAGRLSMELAGPKS